MRNFSISSIIIILLIGFFHSCSRNTDDEANLDLKAERLLSINAKQLADEHNKILRELAKVSSPEAKVYNSKEQIYKDLMAADINLEPEARINVYNYIEKNSDVNQNMNSVISQLNTENAKKLYLSINNQLDSADDYDSIMAILNNNTSNINAISNEFDRQVLTIFTETCKASADYWYNEVDSYGRITIAGKKTPEWVKKDGNGIAQASVGWAVGAAIFGGGPASYFVACGVGGALASIWP